MENITITEINPRQAAANRANGKLSHGPKTPEGKAIASMNAVKHGFFARDPLLAGESATEFAEFRARLFDALQPADATESLLADRVADAGWRLRRFPAVEAAMFTAELLEEQAALTRRKSQAMIDHRLQGHLDAGEAEDPEACRQLLQQEAEIREQLNSPRYALGRVFRRDARAGGGFMRLSRCEMWLDRIFHRSLHELKQLQADRRETKKEQNEPNFAVSVGNLSTSDKRFRETGLPIDNGE